MKVRLLGMLLENTMRKAITTMFLFLAAGVFAGSVYARSVTFAISGSAYEVPDNHASLSLGGVSLTTPDWGTPGFCPIGGPCIFAAPDGTPEDAILTESDPDGLAGGATINLSSNTVLSPSDGIGPFTVPLTFTGNIAEYEITDCPGACNIQLLRDYNVSGTAEVTFTLLGWFAEGSEMGGTSFTFSGTATQAPEPKPFVLLLSGLVAVGIAGRTVRWPRSRRLCRL